MSYEIGPNAIGPNENGLFIFRRDLRIIDNKGLNLLNAHCKKVFTIFIFTPEQVTNENKFKSNNAVQFMIKSLADLANDIHKKGGKLYTFYGENVKVVKECIKAFHIDVVGFNIDYSPYAIKRDESISKEIDIPLLLAHDYYLHQPGTILTGGGKPYQKFTPYYQSAMKKSVDQPVGIKKLKFNMKNITVANSITLPDALKKFVKQENPDILVQGGRQNAVKMMRQAIKTQQHYSTTHNDLWKPTSQLSAYIKFGCVSIREVYKAFRHSHDFIRQLIWRDFYANILYAFPHVLGHAMKPNYSKIKWHHNAIWFNKWCEGKTGFPIVDAGMRQLNETGYMHNRARLIVASFLVKTLLISWEHGEKYFAKQLTDYDPASNNGNWQWIASTGADSQPYFRIFNPMEQSKNFDPECIYIKKWVPELQDLSNKVVHNWTEFWQDFKQVNYPKPICDYKEQKELALKMYGAVFK
jgi:deoxyribodipyrimidine photo-lyase